MATVPRTVPPDESMWFVCGPDDAQPMPSRTVEPVHVSEDMWLVAGPADLTPSPVEQTPAARRVCPIKRQRQLGDIATVATANEDTKKRKLKKEEEGEEQQQQPPPPPPTAAAAANAEAEATRPQLRTIKSGSPCRLALIGATGLVGRACASYLAKAPELGFKVAFFVGSAASVDRSMAEVAAQKEAKLRQHYGPGFWETDAHDESLGDACVCDIDALMEAGPGACDVVLSFLAPRFGLLEDNLIQAGFRVVSISPHRRMDHPLIVPAVNAGGVDFGGLRCVKSPNCCSVGSSVGLLPLVDLFTVKEVCITTFQTLSGRGDALYPAERVVANVYPIGATEENTETYIANEVSRVFKDHPRAAALTRDAIHVSAYRVYVQKNHLLDIRVKIAEDLPANGAKSMLAAVYGQVKYANDIVVVNEAGLPRPRQHDEPNRVTVGNFDVSSDSTGVGTWVRVSVIVDNVAKGAFGNALDITRRILDAVRD